MATLPDVGLLRLKQIIGDKSADPPVPPIIPVCKATWYNGVKSGIFPKPIKISGRSVGWRVEDIKSLL